MPWTNPKWKPQSFPVSLGLSGVPRRDLRFRGPFLEMFLTEWRYQLNTRSRPSMQTDLGAAGVTGVLKNLGFRFAWGREGVRLVKAAARNIRAISFDVERCIDFAGAPKGGRACCYLGVCLWRLIAGNGAKGVRTISGRQRHPGGNDSRRRALSRETQARRDCLQCNGADGP